MIKIMTTADWHFDTWNESPEIDGHNARLLAQEDLMVYLGEEAAKSHGCTWAIVIGDLVERQSTIPLPVILSLNRVFSHWKTLFERVLILPGNHDRPRRAVTEKTEGIHLGRAFPGVVTVDRAQCFGIKAVPGFKLAVLPWLPNPNELARQALDLAEEVAGAPSLLAWHFKVREGLLDNGTTDGSGVPLSSIPWHAFSLCLGGDLHRHQQIAPNAWYQGAPQMHDLGDSKKTVYGVVTVETGKIPTVEFYPTHGPELHRVQTVEQAMKLRENGHFVWIDTDNSVSAAEREVLRKNGVYLRKVGISVEQTDGTLEVRPDMSCLQVYDAYAKTERAQAWAANQVVALDELRPAVEDVLTRAVGRVGATKSIEVVELLRLRLKNFMAYDELDIDLRDQGVQVLTGKNGVGKSTIIEAICFAFAGCALRRRADLSDLVRNGQTDAEVLLDFMVGGTPLRVERRIKQTTKNCGSTAALFENEENISRAGRNAVTDQIYERTGISNETIRRGLAFNRRHAFSFVDAEDSVRKRAFSELTHGYRFDEPLRVAKSDRESFETELSQLGVQLSRIEIRIQEREGRLPSQEQLVKTAAANEAAATKRLADFVADNSGLAEQVSDARQAALRAREQAARITVTQEQVNDARDEEGTILAQWQEADRKYRAFDESLTDARASKVCPTCRQAIAKPSAGQVQSIHECRERERVNCENLATKHKEAKEKADELAAAVDNRKALTQTAETRESEAARIGQFIDKGSGKAEREAEVETAKRQREEAEKSLADNRDGIETLKRELQEGVERKSVLDKAVPIARAVEWLFGNQGLRAFVYASLFASTQLEANRMLMRVTNGQTQIRRLALVPERNGDEKIVIEVDNGRLAKSTGGQSDGQNTTVDLAIQWALFLLNGRYNTLFIDEALDGVDEERGTALLEILQEELSRVPTIFLTTHNSVLIDRAPRLIHVSLNEEDISQWEVIR